MTDFAARRRMMVDTQVRPSDVTKYPIIDALLTVRREVFVPDALREIAYAGENIALEADRVLLEPRTLAKMLDALDIQPTELVLDIGAALGYSAAVIGRLAEAVVAVEEDETWAGEAESLLAAEGADNVAVVAAPLAVGAPKHGPYDVITVQGGIEVLPAAIEDQLKEGGRIAALFTDDQLGTVRVGIKRNGRISWRFAFNASAPVLPGYTRTASFAL
jgi:protein-L-isoaspartate(D-aspartate) O-methyltransferase